MLSICKLKWDLLRTSVTAYKMDKNTFSAPFGIFYVRTEIWKELFKKGPVQPPNGVLLIFKLPFQNESYCNGVCRALWAMSISKPNLCHILKPHHFHFSGGGDKKIATQRIEWNARPKVGSVDNIKHKPGGGDIKVNIS